MRIDPFKLFNENISLVHLILHKMEYDYNIKDDLLQSGFMGLFKASLKYNKELGFKFSSFATKYIEGEIKKELKNSRLIRLPNKTFKIIKLINDNVSKEEIMDRLHISNRMIQEAIAYKALTLFDEKTYIKEDNFTEILLSLNEIERKVILLKYRHNLSQKDIARLLKMSQPSISRILNDTISKLR